MAGQKAAIRKKLCSSGKGCYSGSTAQRFSPSVVICSPYIEKSRSSKLDITARNLVGVVLEPV